MLLDVLYMLVKAGFCLGRILLLAYSCQSLTNIIFPLQYDQMNPKTCQLEWKCKSLVFQKHLLKCEVDKLQKTQQASLMMLKDKGATVPTLGGSVSSNSARTRGRKRFKVAACAVIATVRLRYFYQKRSQQRTPALPSTAIRKNAGVMAGHVSQPLVSLSRHKSRIPLRGGQLKSYIKAHNLPEIFPPTRPSTQPHPPSPPTKNTSLAQQLPTSSECSFLLLPHAEYKPNLSRHTRLRTPSPWLSKPVASKGLTSSCDSTSCPANVVGTGIGTAGCGGQKPLVSAVSHTQAKI